jgi:hypothetical protein
MKINRLETHDRMQHFTKQSFDIGECCQNLIDQRPFGEHPFYIFAHTRTEEDLTKRLIWQPRLTRPKAETNSMLFKAYPGNDNIKVIWMIPAIELWGQYDKGKVTESNIVCQSIENYKLRKNELERSDPEDLSDDVIDNIYKNIAQQAREKRMIEKLHKGKSNG